MASLLGLLLPRMLLAEVARRLGQGFPSKVTNDLAALQNGAKLFVNYCLAATPLRSCATTA
jgi:hypothetical protein